MSRHIAFFGARKPIQNLSKDALRRVIQTIAADHGYRIGRISYVLVDDESLYHINMEYLRHNTYTDIITFDMSENPTQVDGEIYISYERVKENGAKHGDVKSEFLRVIFHGVLHLCGHTDKSTREKEDMRNKEDHYITLYREITGESGMFHVKQR